METRLHPDSVVPAGLLDAIRAFPSRREVEHCGVRFEVSPFEFYAACPLCNARIKLRSFSGVDEIEDVFEWMNQPMAEEAARSRQLAIADDSDADASLS